MCLIFVLFDEYEKFLTTKISWITLFDSTMHYWVDHALMAVASVVHVNLHVFKYSRISPGCYRVW